MPRHIYLAGLLAAALAAPPAHAQPEPPLVGGKVVYRLDLSPTPAPQPASKVYLLPEYRDMRPGNRVQGFLKCFMEQDQFFGREHSEKIQKWLDFPLADLPADVRQLAGVNDGLAYNPPYSRLMVYIDQAARLERVDWNEWFDLRKDGAYYLIPEVQKIRQLASVVRLRMRGEVKNGEFARAVESARTLFGMAKALEQHPTLIGHLVGVAIVTITLSALEEMVQQPGCPNLFWAFADLPSPVLSLRRGIAGERVFVTAQFEGLMKADRALTESELDRYLKSIEELVQIDARQPSGSAVEWYFRSPKFRYTAFALSEPRLAAARALLVENGTPKPLARTLPPLQVVMMGDLIRYEIVRDELFKWVNLPYPQAAGGQKEAEELIAQGKQDSVIGPVLVAAVHKVKLSQVRLDQRVAYLRVIEAVRLHAYQNGGRLPAALADIKLPIPADPVTGKPFEYAVKDGVAVLHGVNPQPESERLNRYYELRLRK